MTTEQKKGTGPMEGPAKPKVVYRLRPVKILPGVYYKITRQRGAEITLEVVPTGNKDIAERLSKLRYPELCQVMEVFIDGLCETLSNEVCVIGVDDSRVTSEVCLVLSRAIACFQGANAHLVVLAQLARSGMSSCELSVHPVVDADKGST
ncbi:MAG: hypothetical protein KA054_03855 [Candidatus Moranbacteria bacterium]|nr:hypothetical protein [Candidatus Moranbacteria bacterium]